MSRPPEMELSSTIALSTPAPIISQRRKLCSECSYMVLLWRAPRLHRLTSRKHRAYIQLVTSSQDGCWLCAMILAAWANLIQIFPSSRVYPKLRIDRPIWSDDYIRISDLSRSLATYVTSRKNLCKCRVVASYGRTPLITTKHCSIVEHSLRDLPIVIRHGRWQKAG
jgi:hypothetical protein